MKQKPVLLFSFRCVALRSSFGNSAEPLFSMFFLFLPFFMPALFSCEGNKHEKENKLNTNGSTSFYPIQEYFISQMKSVDTVSSTIYYSKETNGQKDSSTINKQQFHQIAKSFLENNIEDADVKKYYRQVVFEDNTTGSFTFTYSTENNSLPIQSIDVLLDTATQEVKRIFISQISSHGDSAIIEKMGWKTDQNFFINKIIQVPGNKEITEQVTVVWKD